MAVAAKTPVIVTPGYQLTLTQSEAETLALIMFRIGGDPDRTRRADADSIHKALRSVGVDGRHVKLEGQYTLGNIAFELHHP